MDGDFCAELKRILLQLFLVVLNYIQDNGFDIVFAQKFDIGLVMH